MLHYIFSTSGLSGVGEERGKPSGQTLTGEGREPGGGVRLTPAELAALSAVSAAICTFPKHRCAMDQSPFIRPKDTIALNDGKDADTVTSEMSAW